MSVFNLSNFVTHQLPLYIMYLGGGVLLLGLFYYCYSRITPYSDFQLIAEGNVAAAIALGGGLLGVAVVLASSAWHSNTLVEYLIWGVLASIVQLGLYKLFSWFFRGLPASIAQNNVAVATVLATTSVSIGLINAASLA